MTWKSPLSAKLSAISRPQFHLPLLGLACGGTWNVLITGLPSWAFDVALATALCINLVLRILNDCWVGQNPQGLYLLIYLLTSLLTYLFTYLITYLLNYLLTYLFTYILTYLLT
jgi:hypothetical protein